jgi:type I restriction enzyme S subunit
MEYVKLGEYCTITSSKRIFAHQYVANGIPFYRSKEIIEKNNNEIVSDPLFISVDVYNEIKEKFGVPKFGDILLTSVGTLGVPYLVKDETFYFKDGNLTWLKDFDNRVSSKYIYYWLSSSFGKASLLQRAIGSSQPAITIEILKNYKIIFPNISVQCRITSILSAYDNLIENNNRRIRLLEQMAENLYKEWFVRFRFPGHEKAEFENGLPKGWRVVTIKDICNVTDGVHNTIQDTPQSKYYLLSCKNIKDGKLIIGENERTIDEETFLKLRKRTQLAKGDILVSSVGTIGETILLNEDPTFFEFQRSVAMIKPDKRYVNSNFMYEMLKYMRKDLVNAAHGVAQQCLFLGDINKMRVFLPAMHTIAAFDEKVQPIYDQILSLSKQLNLLSRQRDLLLPRLMSGKLEVKV